MEKNKFFKNKNQINFIKINEYRVIEFLKNLKF